MSPRRAAPRLTKRDGGHDDLHLVPAPPRLHALALLSRQLRVVVPAAATQGMGTQHSTARHAGHA
jgi:hypothetical protein